MINTVTKFKTYMTAPTKCYIPKCKAHCCINAPLPEGFLAKHKNELVREVFHGVNIGVNDTHDKFNSIVYSTRPLSYIGHDENGKMLYGIPKKVLEMFEIESIEQIGKLLDLYKDVDNYCPFIKETGFCNVYKDRPQICKDFGTDTKNPLNKCPEKSSRLEIIKDQIKKFFDYKGTFKAIKTMLTKK